MPFGLWTWVGPKNHVGLVDDGPDPPMQKGNFERKWAAYCTVQGLCAKRVQPTEMPFGMWTRVSQRKRLLDGM